MENATLNKEISVIKTQISKAISAANSLTIETKDDMPKAVDLLSKIKSVGKLITEKKEGITKPLNEALKNARAFFAPVESEYQNAEGIVKGKMVEFNNKETLAQMKKNEEIAKKVEAGKMTFEKAAEKMEAVIPQKSVQTANGGVQFRTVREVVIGDESLLPREYLTPDLAKIKKVALAGVSIPGVSVIEKKVVAGTTY